MKNLDYKAGCRERVFLNGEQSVLMIRGNGFGGCVLILNKPSLFHIQNGSPVRPPQWCNISQAGGLSLVLGSVYSLISKNLKIKIYKTIILPVVL